MKKCTGVVWNYNLDRKKMENFKLDLTKLTPVAEKERVKGNWYVVSEGMDDKLPVIVLYHSSNRGMDCTGEQSWAEWNYWFAIPPNLPGFPAQELPDEFELKEGEYEYDSDYHKGWSNISKLTDNKQIRFRRIKPKLPTTTIPEQTESERREWLQKELEKLGK